MDRPVSGVSRPVVSLHINRVEGLNIARAFVRMGLDRRELARVPGLLFWKLLGTGRGRTFSLRDADPTTWGLFAVWESADAHDRFMSESNYAHLWSGLAVEQWSARLRAVRWKGSWSGRQPFGGLAGDPAGPEDLRHPEVAGVPGVDGPIAVLTRARVRPTKWRSFAAAVPPVADAVNATPGLRYTVGIGEAPIGLQATFSLWDSESAMTSFAYKHDAHREVIARTRADGWYAEELFARFRVVSTTGTINGRSL